MTFQWMWLSGELDNPVEGKSFAALKVILNGEVLTRLYDQIAGGERETINVALYPLALSIAENWWSLLHEPRKSSENESLVEIRHSLDSYMNGYVFPAMTLWSGGDDAIVVEHPIRAQRYSNLEFLPPADTVTNVPRDEVEGDLFNLVGAVLDRMPATAPDATPLRDAWTRVLESLGNADERQYCEAAGRLGIDPYDPDAEDISRLAEGLSEHLFANICEAATAKEVQAATEWARERVRRIASFPNIDVSHFGKMPERNPREKIWVHGYEAARLARTNLHLENFRPRRVVDEIFGAAVRGDQAAMFDNHSLSLEAVAARRNGGMRVALPKASARQRRSRLCRASYLAWKVADGEYSAVTTATTVDQQASRAFAAELLAPRDLLRELAGTDGLTPDKVEAFAKENVCPEQTVIWQAYNHDISLRGVALPRSI